MHLVFPSHHFLREIILAGLLSLCWVLLPGSLEEATARPALVDNLERPTLSFRLDQLQPDTRLLEHGRATGRGQFGQHVERVLLQSPIGGSATLSYQIPKAPAIGELRMTLWVMTNCPGVRLAARVTLPRTKNPTTSAPYQVTVRGTGTTQLGVWQTITLGRLPERLARQARVVRLQTKDPLDERGAFVQELLLIVPGSGRPCELLIDRVEVEGVLQPDRDQANIRQAVSSSELRDKRAQSALDSQPIRTDKLTQPGHQGNKTPHPKVPRIIQWQGEPLDFLAKLDFDAVAMERPATLQEMSAARALGLFLICPPPTPAEIRAGTITEAFSAVMAWDLGSLRTPHDLDSATLIKGLLTRHDPDFGRLTIIRPNRYVHEASRIADILLIGRDTLGADLSLSDYATWLTGRKRLARPGTPFWMQIDTELPPRASAQQTLLSNAGKRPALATQRRLAAHVALATTLNSQGFYFTSHTSLATKTLPTRSRALTLELTNLRIGLIKPWLASGKLISMASSNNRQLTATVLQVERSYLLVPIHWQSTTTPSHEPRRRSDKQISFLLPSVPESCEAYFLTPAGASTIRHRRVTGGIRILFESSQHEGFVLFTEDGHAFSSVARYIQKHSYRTTQRTRELASIRLQQTVPFANTLPTSAITPIQPFFRSTQALIEQCDALLAQRNVEVAYQRAVAANTLLDEIEIALAPTTYFRAVRNPSAPVPATNDISSSRSLSRSAEFKPQVEKLFSNPSSETGAFTTKLFGANFENLDELQQTGWRHQRLPTQGLTSSVFLSSESPYQGSYCLEMEVQPTGPTPPVVATAPVWVSSSPIHVQAGEKIEIRGMVRIPKQLTGSVDGLQIFDSLGGMPLALRIQQTNSWQPFHLVRIIPADTEMTITFALTGLGKAQIDQLTVSKMPTSIPRAARQPSKEPFPSR